MESTELIRESLRAISSEPSEQAESGSSASRGSSEGCSDAIIDPTLFHDVRVQYAKAATTILFFSLTSIFCLEYFCRVAVSRRSFC